MTPYTVLVHFHRYLDFSTTRVLFLFFFLVVLFFKTQQTKQMEWVGEVRQTSLPGSQLLCLTEK